MKPVKINQEQVTKEDLQKALPSRKNAITDEIVEIINKSQDEPEFQGESLLQSAMVYERVMIQHQTSIKDYLNAIKFCAYLISMEDNLVEAYKKTFAERDFVKNRLDAHSSSTEYRDLTSAASRYRRSKLVTDILTYSQVPFDLMFTGERYKAIAVLADTMMNARYDRDRINAADKLLMHTSSNSVKVDLNIGVKESSAVENLQMQLAELAARQKTMLEAGATNLGVLGALKAEVTDVEVEE